MDSLATMNSGYFPYPKADKKPVSLFILCNSFAIYILRESTIWEYIFVPHYLRGSFGYLVCQDPFFTTFCGIDFFTVFFTLIP